MKLGTLFQDRFGNNVPVPGYARVFVTSTARRTWYDGLLLNLDRPLTANGRWGLNLAYTISFHTRPLRWFSIIATIGP